MPRDLCQNQLTYRLRCSLVTLQHPGTREVVWSLAGKGLEPLKPTYPKIFPLGFRPLRFENCQNYVWTNKKNIYPKSSLKLWERRPHNTNNLLGTSPPQPQSCGGNLPPQPPRFPRPCQHRASKRLSQIGCTCEDFNHLVHLSNIRLLRGYATTSPGPRSPGYHSTAAWSIVPDLWPLRHYQ